MPVEFLRPIPSAALIPLLFLTLGTNFKSEVFLATFGAFWPILVQTMYGIRDVDPVTTDTARSFRVPRSERLWRITLPELRAVHRDRDADRIRRRADPRVHRRAVHGDARSRQKLNYAQSFGLTTQLYALALATGVLGLATHLVFTAIERRALRWHPSQRAEAL